jgi:L,D-peptidoglycan transpeptidase YkuD (ErfK/YbiS/YcfS/YnhG family)
MPNDILVRADGYLDFAGRTFRCALGRAGIAARKSEGDGACPQGRFALRRVLYRADRMAGPPATALPVSPIARDMGWCDDPEDPLYNRPITLPYAARHEVLWRDDGLYDLVAVLGYNDAPVVPGRGSAIFLHIARPAYEPTEGCVALARDDLLAVLAACRADTHIRIGI